MGKNYQPQLVRPISSINSRTPTTQGFVCRHLSFTLTRCVFRFHASFPQESQEGLSDVNHGNKLPFPQLVQPPDFWTINRFNVPELRETTTFLEIAGRSQGSSRKHRTISWPSHASSGWLVSAYPPVTVKAHVGTPVESVGETYWTLVWSGIR